MKKIIFLCAVMISSYVYGAPIVYIAIPKGGTHLMYKYLCHLMGKGALFTAAGRNGKMINGHDILEIKRWLNNAQGANRFLISHLTYTPECASLFASLGIKPIFLLRDPRDQIVSYAHYIRRSDTVRKYAAAIKDLSFDQILLSLIQESRIYDIEWESSEGVTEFYGRFLPWMEFPGCCIVRFEDLVGPEGGGSLDAQYETMIRIACHVGACPSEEKIKEIAANLFGGTWSFRKGSIGAWKDYFSEEHKRVFKEVAGQLLIDLGYEKDFDW